MGSGTDKNFFLTNQFRWVLEVQKYEKTSETGLIALGQLERPVRHPYTHLLVYPYTWNYNPEGNSKNLKKVIYYLSSRAANKVDSSGDRLNWRTNLAVPSLYDKSRRVPKKPEIIAQISGFLSLELAQLLRMMRWSRGMFIKVVGPMITYNIVKDRNSLSHISSVLCGCKVKDSRASS